MSNRLINETSPYLLQHAHNPVNWYPWGEEALQKAVEEDKPILVSIGYAACHWCHVMERESFENAETADIMNRHFINIKIDREERPDLDHIYMDAVQAMTGSGGWPLNVFLTPDRKPFYGGTYFPPVALANRASWQDVLFSVIKAFKRNREGVTFQAGQLTAHLLEANSHGLSTEQTPLQPDEITEACKNLLQQADKTWGGFGAAPKFPQSFSLQFLLRYYTLHKEDSEAHATLQHALCSLDKMIDGGIYDQIGGGFARYATDREWLVPHFEKMLYDNALMVSVLSEAYQTMRNKKYLHAIKQTLDFTERELMHDNGGFYAALDADSEGVEGKFYVWEYDEIQTLLGTPADLYCQYYDVTPDGNWESTNILHVKQDIATFAQAHNMTVGEVEELLSKCNASLLSHRNSRTRPSTDDKIILAWNALMNIAYSKAYMATGENHYLQVAVNNMQTLLSIFDDNKGGFHHVWKNGQAKFPAFLDDYAYTIQALLTLQKITADTEYLLRAQSICEYVERHFPTADGYFYYTSEEQEDVIIRKKEIYDGATPSGNAIMAQNLLELGILTDNPQWKQQAEKMVSGLQNVILKYPTSFGAWLNTLHQLTTGSKEIALIGDYEEALSELLQQPLPHCIVMAAQTGNTAFPLLNGRNNAEKLTIYLCENYACKQPVHTVSSLLSLMKEKG
ncbi:MAG: thioredoxin domain-containing protein [Niabella sp.]